MSVLYVRNKDGNFVPIKTIQGEPGPRGPAPVRGEDYFTLEDQEAMVKDVENKAKSYIDEQLGISVEEIDALIGGDA